MKQERKPTGKKAEDEIDRFLKTQERRERRKTITTILIVVALLLGAAVALTRVDYQRLENLALSIKSDTLPSLFPETPQVAAGCDPTLPANSSIYVETPFEEYREDFPRLDIVNGHTFPVVVRITSFDQALVYQSVSVHPGRSTILSGIPPGRYGIVTLVGNQWCNMQKGFLDGTAIRSEQLLEMRAGKNERLIFASRGTAPSDLQLTMEEWLPATQDALAGNHVAAPAPAPAPAPVVEQSPQAEAPADNEATPDQLPPSAAGPASPPAVEKEAVKPETPRKSSGQSWREKERQRCYDYYAGIRDQIVTRMKFDSSPRPGESFRNDLHRNEITYQECLSRVAQ